MVAAGKLVLHKVLQLTTFGLKDDAFQVIYTLLNKETKGDMLPVPALTIGGKAKTMKKDEQYRDNAQ